MEEEILPPKEELDALKIVGLGASAGGIQALELFFRDTPVDSGMAFVVVMHLSPEHESRLAELLAGMTPMPVEQVTESVRLEPNRVYVIPPSRHLAVSDGTLRLVEPDGPFGRQLAIDLFFRSLAETHGPHTTGVIMSGAGEDGTLGLRQVKEMGGLTIAQDPLEAEFDSMPRHAIASGNVDYVLPAREMTRQILAYWRISARIRIPVEAAPAPAQGTDGPDIEAALVEILSQLRGQTGHDFAHYKRATMLRRIGRRLQINHLENLPAYNDYLRGHPAEIQALLADLLISVTRFFRDPTAWETLERDVIPRLFDHKGAHDEVRVWVCGCATGEEAYSVAILLCEHAASLSRPPHLKVFATDMDPDAIVLARDGSYPASVAADVPPERLRRWFLQDNGRYRIRREVREIVLFAMHDILKDTPFSRLDMITCRNLLIYLNRRAQEQVFGIFHFGLRPEGRLFLGASESLDGSSALFAPTNKTHRIYGRRPTMRPLPFVPPVPVVGGRRLHLTGSVRPDRAAEPAFDQPGSWGELHRNLLEVYAPPSILVNEEYQILHLSNNAGDYLRLTGGEPTLNLLRTIHPDLRVDVSTALYAAAEGRDQVRQGRIRLMNDQTRAIRIMARSLKGPESAGRYFLVLFEEVAENADEERRAVARHDAEAASDAVPHLEDEISRLKEQLRTTVEQYEATVEELKAANEEQQAVNEELRSASEELETSREELQSVNEELLTVNQELKTRMEEISRANSDLQNLLVSTDIGTIFLGKDLRIQRYTPPMEALFNLIPTDVGRPLSHVTHRLDYPGLTEDTERVLKQLAVIEREVRGADGSWYLAQLRPYRTLEDRIDGVVVAFVDITKLKQAEEALQRNQRELEERVKERTASLTEALASAETAITERLHAEEEREGLMRRLVQAQEEERARLSLDLHDRMGQRLTEWLLELKALQDNLPDGDSIERVERLMQAAGELSHEIHHLSWELRPPALDDLGLTATLSNAAREFSERTGIRVDFHSTETARFPEETETALYRIVQEALNNVARHSGASQVSILLERREGDAVLIVEDNGSGFDPDAVLAGPASGRHLGLRGMRERAALLGASLEIESTPGRGTTLFVRVPTEPPGEGGSRTENRRTRTENPDLKHPTTEDFDDR